MQAKIEEANKDDNNNEPAVPKGWNRCHAYVKPKRRFCRQEQCYGSLYCGNHQRFVVQSSTCTNTSNTTGIKKRKRIPCPMDPSHDIFEDQLDIHVPKCPKVKAQKRLEQLLYYRHECNCGGHGALRLQQQQPSNPSSLTTIEWAKRVAMTVLQVHQELFFDKTTTATDKKDKAFQEWTAHDIFHAIPTIDLSKAELEAGLAQTMEQYRIKTGGPKHIHQQASMVGHLRKIGFQTTTTTTTQNTSSSNTILELGAGRGITGLVVASVIAKATAQTTRLYMVERGSASSRADKCIRRVHKHPQSYPPQQNNPDCYMDLSKISQVARIPCDLSHVHMPLAVPVEQQQQHIIVVAKHLCGVGTDLALKSLQPIRDRIATIVMATCCHGVCDWKDYVGREALSTAMTAAANTRATTSLLQDFGEKEFELLRVWSSGTVRVNDQTSKKRGSNVEQGDKETEHSGCNCDPSAAFALTKVVDALKLACKEQGLGRACQRLIDYGRCEYMRTVLFDEHSTVKLVHYVPESVTPQNALLIATRQSSQ